MLSKIYRVNGGPCISLVIWVLSLLLFVMLLETKWALIMSGRIGGVCWFLCLVRMGVDLFSPPVAVYVEECSLGEG